MISASSNSASVQTRASVYYRDAYSELAAGVDRMMVWLLAIEWVGVTIFSALRSPFAWEGTSRYWNPHFLAALFAGPALIFPVIALARFFPASHLTRHFIAVAQMLISVLLIDATGGRIETHFHVFGSLAFLAFYRDWRVLATASTVAALDHFFRGQWWPQSVYGVSTVGPYRWLEHVWWVVFEDFFLFLAIRKGGQDSKELAFSKSLLYEGAYHDVLTGLANRRFLMERFELLIKHNQSLPIAILFVDLDRFKQVNDIHGHTVGDKLLLQAAARLTGSVPPDSILARIGGDEFIVVLHGPATADARETGMRLLQCLTTPFSIDGHELMLSATIGVGLYPDHGSTLEVLQEKADQAMYSAKAHGRNQLEFYSDEAAKRKLRVENVARGLFDAQVNNQLQLHFQPLINKEGQVSSFEALLRWMHPVYGSIPPSDFIPMAERSGVIVPIGEWVLTQACRECRSWQERGTSPLGVSVNISAVQFEQQDFPDLVKRILSQEGLSPSLLTLEITESVLTRNLVVARERLTGLRALGINVALDDFGTGYSSVTSLSVLPADSIKLDRSFVRNEFGKQASVVESIIEIAHRIGLSVTAEGVENQAEADWLMGLKCDEMQGFKFSRPIPAVLVLHFLAERLAAAHPERNREYESQAMAS